MPSIRKLTDLSALASAALPSGEAIQRALPLLQEGLAAEDVFLIYGGTEGFRSFGTRPRPELSDVALWLVDRDLTSRRRPCAFDLRDGRVEDFRSAGSRRPADYVAALIPVPNRSAEMFVARGRWPQGLGIARARFLEAALPGLALILEHRIDSSRADRQRFQMNALANITRVMSESEDLETVLNSIGSTIAAVTGIDYVSIDIVDSDGVVKLRSVNSLHPRMEERRGKWRRGGSRPDPVRDEVLKTRRPMVFPDAQNDDRIPESGRDFFVRILVRSVATFPLLAKEEVLGTLSFASHRPLGFGASEVELLEGLTAQVASAIKGIQIYQELEESREQLEQSMGIEHHLARTDPLTGIPNLRFLQETVEAECARARRYGHPLSVIVLDLDHFKTVNDGQGHAAGDDALRYVAHLARESCREVDVVGRCGGDEFLFVLPFTGAKDATAIAERFRRRLAESSIANDGEPVRVTVSLGVAEWDNETMEEPSALLRQADRMMYMAKAVGRNRTMVADGKSARAA